ncbi:MULTISPECIES: MlaD family protein [Tsukamurella]|uniref:MlaD family protein n=1 Tax=Tsukamurella strandjordii TaxID=147577 RepID=A0AA90SLM8_9ACTN|nr:MULTISPECIES: MlaD family protein [Tsukamurella]MDP0398437.1 MlaD family protein [Tsukamurella strandjordii]GIZ97704.1 putative MCE family protein [Tsukamurella sp. TY48]
MRTKNTRAAIWLAVALVITLLVSAGIFAALRNPVDGDTRGYEAHLSDASGLRVGSDVRLRGVLIGKVTSVDVRGTDTGNEAVVGFTAQNQHPVTSTTRVAVKYRNLTGERFIEVEPGTSGGGIPTTSIPMSRTTPSFDITTLFNGLAPVLRTLSPDDVNELTRNLLGLLQGDDTTAAQTFGAIDKITANLADRQVVIKTLIDNVTRVANMINDYSPQVVEFVTNFDLLLTKVLENLDEFRRTATYGPGFGAATNRTLTALGLSKELDVERLFTTAFKDPQAAVQAMSKLPGLFTGVAALLGTPPTTCSKGEAQLPKSTTVLLGGTNVTVCLK